MNKFLGIDYGERKIGLALSAGNIAVPLNIIPNDDKLLDAIEKIIKSESIDQVILGLPVNSVGEETEATKKVLDFEKKLSELVTVPIIKFDERLSSRQAQVMGAGSNDDAHAAALVLQSYLDSLQKS